MLKRATEMAFIDHVGLNLLLPRLNMAELGQHDPGVLRHEHIPLQRQVGETVERLTRCTDNSASCTPGPCTVE